MMTSDMTTVVPIVALGVYRHVAATMDPFLLTTPFRLAAILDLTCEPAAFRYDAHNLGVVIQNLHPPPKVFITGAGISPEMTAESISVWDAYVKATKVTGTLVINVSERLRYEG